MKGISVISVDFHGGIFKQIQKDSLEKLADPRVPYELIIHDNGSDQNIGHAKGVQKLISEAKYDTILLLDIDSHILLPGWNKILMDLHDERWKDGVRLIAGEGGQLKPVRPCVMCFDKSYFLDHPEMTFEPQTFMGAKFDVGVLFYIQVLSRGDKVDLFKYGKSSYPNTQGNDYCLNGKPFVYHHWYGTRWYNVHGNRVHDQVDSLKWEDFINSVESLKEQFYG